MNSGEYIWLNMRGRREGGRGKQPVILAVGRVLELRNNHGYEAYGMCLRPYDSGEGEGGRGHVRNCGIGLLWGLHAYVTDPASHPDEFDAKYSLNGVCTYVSSNVRAVLGYVAMASAFACPLLSRPS